MNKIIQVFFTLSLALMAGCASLGVVSPVNYDIRGRIQDNTYTSPSGSFRVTMPMLLTPGAKVRDNIPQPNALWVSFSDDLCREFIVVEYPSEIGNKSLDDWIDSTVIPELTKAKASMLERKTVKTRYGQGVFIRYRVPEAAPCVSIKISEGRQVSKKPDAEVGAYNFIFGGYIYRLMYVLDDNPVLDAFWIKRRPLDEILAQFVEGFEILREPSK